MYREEGKVSEEAREGKGEDARSFDAEALDRFF